MSTSEPRSTRSTPAIPTAAPLSRRVHPAIVAMFLVAVSLVSAWSVRTSAADPDTGEPVAAITPPSLASIDSEKPAASTMRRVGVVEQVTSDGEGITFTSDSETFLLSVGKPVGGTVTGDIIDVSGREVARSRFGQITLRGTFTVVKAMPRASPPTGPSPGPLAVSQPSPGSAARVTPAPASTAPRLDTIFGK